MIIGEANVGESRRKYVRLLTLMALRILPCAAVMACVAIIGVRWIRYGKNSGESDSTAVRIRPLVIPARHRYLPDQGFRGHIKKALVRLSAAPPPSRWVDLLHTLRFLGTSGKISGADTKWTGRELLSFIVDAQKTAERFGAIHVANRHGVIFLGWNPHKRDQGEPHRDKTLAVIGRLGISASQAIRVDDAEYTVTDVVHATEANFAWDQELPFTALGLAYYLPPAKSWTNKYGQRIDFDAIGMKLCDLPIGEGACFGTHNLDALAALLAADGQYGILSDRVRGRAIAVLKQAVLRLERSQSPEGWWNRNWFRGETPHENDPDNELSVIVVTSHSLEWLAVAPDGVECAPERTERAIKYLVKRILGEPSSQLDQRYGVYTHAGTAIQTWVRHPWNEVSGQDK